jgi:uncharacterized membrane protein
MKRGDPSMIPEIMNGGLSNTIAAIVAIFCILILSILSFSLAGEVKITTIASMVL